MVFSTLGIPILPTVPMGTDTEQAPVETLKLALIVPCGVGVLPETDDEGPARMW